MEDQEKWLPIVEYEGWYSVSNLGRIRRDKAQCGTRIGKINKSCANKIGYSIVVLSKNCIAKTFRVHFLVTQSFLGEKPKGLTTNHIDGNKTNNKISNLEYSSYSENGLHAYRLGLKIGMFGIKNPNCKISKNIVIKIRKKYKSENISQSKLGKIYGISQTQVGRIIRNERWNYIK